MEIFFIIALIAIFCYLFYVNRSIISRFKNTASQIENPSYNSNFDLSKYNSIQKEAICPNCLVKLDSFPQRKRKCKSCKKDIIRVNIPDTKEIVLLNETEGYELKGLVDKYYTDQSLIYELTSYEFESTKDEVLKLRKDFFDKHNTNSDDEFFMNYTNRKLNEQVERNNFNNAKLISLKMLNRYKEHLENEYESNENAQLDYKPAYIFASNIVKFCIMDTRKLIDNNFNLSFYTKEISGCTKKIYDSKRFSPEEMLNNAKIPCDNCTADIYNLYDCVKCIIVSPTHKK